MVVEVIFLMRATGTKFTFMQRRSKIFLLAIPFFITTVLYYFIIIVVKRTFPSETPLKNFLDIAYPSFDIITLTFSSFILGLSVNFFGGKYRFSLFAILGGFGCMYMADFMLAYTTSVNIYYNSSLSDFIFTFGTYLLTWGTLSFYLTPKQKGLSSSIS